MPFSYMLQCSDGSFYVGSTWDLGERVTQHMSGRGATYTSRRRPVRLVWAQEFERIDEAFNVEKKIQGWGREKRIALVEGRYGDLPGLARKGRQTQPCEISDEARARLDAD